MFLFSFIDYIFLLLFCIVLCTSETYEEDEYGGVGLDAQERDRHIVLPASPLPKPRSRSKHRRYADESSYYFSGRHKTTPPPVKKNQKKPPVKVTKPYDPIYYSDTTSYYTDSSERSVYDSDIYIYSTPGPSSSSIKPNADKGGIKFGAVGEDKEDDVEDQLTTDAWAALPNRAELEADHENIKQNWQQQLNRFNQEWETSPYSAMRFIDNKHYFSTACYQLGSTYLHAKKHLTDYYRIRYAYHNKKEFEVGYLVHEIVYKYGALLEIFHNVQGRFYNTSRFFDSATPTYMLYMYSNIVSLSQTIIHLCNMLHEVDNKYAGYFDPDDFYEDEKKPSKGKEGPIVGPPEGLGLNAAYYEEKERQRLKRKKLRELARKEKAMRDTDTFSSTKRTRSPRTYKQFPHHYGWSIEYW